MFGTWQPVFGHVEPGESASGAAFRELREETGLAVGGGLSALYALERVRPYYLPELDAVVASPRFVAVAGSGWSPRLCEEHDAFRWFDAARRDRDRAEPGRQVRDRFDESEAEGALFWPSQRESWAEAWACIFEPRGRALRGATRLYPSPAAEGAETS
jgi:8-oxo-dGTP pyrophosphatase MutT (NUDIX family)